MATYTSNLNLYMPDSTDDFGDFRAEHNDNMVKIDNAIGGGGGSGGHTIVNENGADMPAEGKLQFTGNVSVTDDSGNGKTVVDILGGGGNVYGAFIDTNRIIQAQTAIPANTTATYTATEDCYLLAILRKNGDASSLVYVDGEQIGGIYTSTGYTTDLQGFFIKKGQVVTITVTSESHYTVYGLTQGTSGIFTPIIYSDTERVVGVWRDNKPLYQRTFVFETPLAVSYSSFTDTTIDSTDIENIVDNHATHADGTNYGSLIADPTRQSHTKVGLQTNRNGNNANVKTLTIRYTKISDVAGSGNWNTDGVPTVHYSTSEQVIGTWENGKPLYQRIFTTNTLDINTSDGALYSRTVDIVDYIADVDKLFVDIGKSWINVSGVTRGLISASQQGSQIALYTHIPRLNCTVTLTVQYTKVTD